MTTCYGTPTSYTPGICNSVGVYPPITDHTVLTTPYTNGSPGPMAEVVQLFTNPNSYSLNYETDEYNWGRTLSRKTITTYDYNTSCGVPSGSTIVDKPCSVTVENSSGGTVASTTYTYNANGDLLSESSGGLTLNFNYNSNGTLNWSKDAAGNQTSYGYGANSCGAFPDTVTPPLSALATTSVWNCNGALPTRTTDANGQETTFGYDNINRLTSISYPDGGSVGTTYTSPNQTDIETAITSSLSRHDQLILDGLGRVSTQSLVSDPDGQTDVTTSYDALGRVLSTSNPHRTSSTGGDTYGYDALSRVTSVTHADSNSIGMAYGGGTAQSCSASTYGYGYSTVYTDEATNQRQTFTDALGRIIEVDEPSLGVYTCYSYDALNDLTGVTQGSQTRSYHYDGLARLTQATTPESGITYYYYTTSGGALCSGSPSAVCRRTDARGITTTYAYNDPLNRLTGKSYSDGTPAATYAYDQASVTVGSWGPYTITNPKGRLTSAVTTSGSSLRTALVYSYDPMGRPTNYWQCPPFYCANWGLADTPYSYDLAGDVESWVHPSYSIPITNTISAAQRVTQITAGPNNYSIPQALAQNISYTPWGALSGLTDGCIGTGCTQIQETYTYNNRMQPWMLQVGNSENSFANYCLVYNYYLGTWTPPTSCPSTSSVPTTGSDNNGNVTGLWYQDNVNPSFSHTEAYGYDGVNRLTSAVATGNSTYNLAYGYDRYGNSTCVLNGNTNGPCAQIQYHSANNQISGSSYDAAGNTTYDGTYTYTWDAEGRLSTSSQGATLDHTYTYNALGQRAEDIPDTQTGNTQEWFYDASGQVLGDFFTGGPGWWHITVPALGRIFEDTENWYVGAGWIYHYNALGSALTATRQDGTEVLDTQLYPWGWGWLNQGGWSTWSTGIYAGLISFQCQFAPCMDQSQTRDYSGYRWMTPDALGGSITNPQSLNRYAYALNNPTTLTDPTGLQSGNGSCYQYYCGPTDCPAQFDSCYSTSGGDYIGVAGNTWSVFSWDPCPAGEVGPGDCPTGNPGFVVSMTGLVLSSTSVASGPGPGGGGGLSTSRPSASQCVTQFYNTTPGKVVQFFSPLALAPGWNPNWGTNAADWAGAIISKGGSLLFVQSGETIETLNGIRNISSPIESIVGNGLGIGEVIAAPVMAVAASADALAHGACRAVEQGGLPQLFGN